MKNFTDEGRKETNFVVTIIAVIVVLAGIIGLFVNYSSKFYERVMKRETIQLKMAADNIRTIVAQDIKRCIAVIDTGEEVFHHYGLHDKKDIVHVLNDVKHEGSGFAKVGFVDLRGNIIFDDGSEAKCHNTALRETICANKNYISHFSEHNDPQKSMLLIAVPAHHDNQVRGALFTYYPVSAISENIGMAGQSIRYFQLFDADGGYISIPDNKHAFSNKETLWEELRRYDISDDVTIDEIRENMRAGREGTFYFENVGQGRYVVYEPLGINDWYIFSVLVESNVLTYTGELHRYFLNYLFWLVLGMVILFLIFIYNDLDKRRIISDKNQQLLIRNKLFTMILAKTRDIPFEVHLDKKRLIRYLGHISDKVTDYEVIEDFCADTMVEQEQIHPEDYERYKKLYDDVTAGKVVEPQVFNMQINGRWTWVKIYLLNVENNILIGFLEDYNEQNQQQEQVVMANKKASQDNLTGLLNRGAFKTRANELLERTNQGTVSALFLIDLDYFKEVNDTLGHIVGDQVLHDVAISLKSVVRGSDLVGRLGGDEFVVFIADAADIHGIHRCAQKLNEALKGTYSRDGKEVKVSASIGVAVAEPGMSFDDLYSLADKAVYDVKNVNKDGYQIAQTEKPAEKN